MNTHEIERLLFGDDECRRVFKGVYAADVFVDVHRNETTLGGDEPALYVVNNRESNHPGEHWIAVYCNRSPGVSEFFDSYGLAPSIYRSVNAALGHNETRYTDVRLQNVNSDSCGHYCVAYCLAVTRNLSLDRFVDYWKKREDEDVKRLVDGELAETSRRSVNDS
jgi:hypothetical protein